MKDKIVGLALICLVGSPCFALGEPTSKYLSVARVAERRGEHRVAIFCLCSILLEIMQKRESAKGLSQTLILSELSQQFTSAKLADKAAKLAKLSSNKGPSGRQFALEQFLILEMDAADPAKHIEVFSDGTIHVMRKGWSVPGVAPVSFCPLSAEKNIFSTADPQYASEISRYWWFKLPSQQELSTKPIYVPYQPKEPLKNSVDGAFKTESTSK